MIRLEVGVKYVGGQARGFGADEAKSSHFVIERDMRCRGDVVNMKT